jgi:hypothetical protein
MSFYDTWKTRSDRDEYAGGFEPPVEQEGPETAEEWVTFLRNQLWEIAAEIDGLSCKIPSSNTRALMMQVSRKARDHARAR